jgi:hypothetical protein
MKKKPFNPLLASFAKNDTEEALAAMVGVQAAELAGALAHLRSRGSPEDVAWVKTSFPSFVGAVALLNGTASRTASPGLRNVAQRATAALIALRGIAQEFEVLKDLFPNH